MKPTIVFLLLASLACVPPPARVSTAPASKVNVNTASEAALKSLPGIGSKEARAIVAHRAAHGPFRTIDELTKVKKVGRKDVAKIKPYVVVQ